MNDILVSHGLYSQTRFTNGLYALGRQFSTVMDLSAINYINPISFTKIATGTQFAAGISGGKLYTWGLSTAYATGQNTTSFIVFPTQIGSDTDWTSVSASSAFAAGIRGGKLYTWGSNASYATGQNTNTGSTQVPTQIGSDTDWEMVSCSAGFTFAIKAGVLYSTGANTNGRLGQNLTAGGSIFSTVFAQCVFSSGTNSNFVWVSAGNDHTLAVKSDGTLWVCGSQSFGKCGNGVSVGSLLSFQQAGSATNWAKVYCGVNHSALIKSDGTLWMCGQQSLGRLGNGSSDTAPISTPVKIGSDTDWESVSITSISTAAGTNEFTWAVKGGKLYGTGVNSNGQLGFFNNTTDRNVFERIGKISGVKLISPNHSGYAMIIK